MRDKLGQSEDKRKDSGAMPIVDDHVDQILMEDNAYLFGRGGIYYLRINLPNGKQHIRTLKVKADGSDEKKLMAIGKAKVLYDEIMSRVNASLSLDKLTVSRLCDIFIKNGERGLKVNQESKSEVARIDGGRGAWTTQSLSQSKIAIKQHILPFFTKKDLATRDITQIQQMDIDNWIRWRQERYPDEAPGTFAKRNTTMRHIFKLARRMGERFTPPQIEDIPKEIGKRRRKVISDDQYIELLQHVKDVYSKERSHLSTDKNPEPLWGRNQKYAYMFRIWLETISFTGIRPWTTLKNAIKMEHIQNQVDGRGKETLTLRRFEKGHDYVAVASPYWKRSLDRLEMFYKPFGITNDREYMFVHPETYQGDKIKAGEPIINFRSQWETAIGWLGWNDRKILQSERISPYSLRHRFAGKKLIENEISPFELSQIMGTSLKIISLIYVHYSSVANYSRLTQGDLEATIDIDYFDKKTGRREGSVIANSLAHQRVYQGGHNFIVAPDEVIPFKDASEMSLQELVDRETIVERDHRE